MKRVYYLLGLIILVGSSCIRANAQTDSSEWWHGIKRDIHYRPEGEDFILVNGKRRFNRALYGTNTAFRVEAGDLPEFALYMPGMGGNCKFGLLNGKTSKWVTDANSIRTIYRPGGMLYEIRDSLLGQGVLTLTILAEADAEGMVIRLSFSHVPPGLQLVWVYGAASGKKFSRDGDIGADPESSFYLQPGYCKDNSYKIQNGSFLLSYGSGKVLSEEDRYGNKPAGNDVKKLPGEETNPQKHLIGIVPPTSAMRIADAASQANPSLLSASGSSATPIIMGTVVPAANKALYFSVINPLSRNAGSYQDLEEDFEQAELARKKLAGRVKVTTPDPYINTLGGALSVAANAIWEEPSYLHGAVAWRMRLNAWRGPYVADPLGWHDRARKHFSSYALSQVTSPPTGPVVADTALHLARQLEKMGTSVFSSGYISRNPANNTVAHHYDMNLVFVDQLLTHFNWTGDLGYVKEMWPLLQRHLAWEKKNFDRDGDGLYDAYAAIWASDALQYSGGGVTHSSAYNYRSNKVVAELAKLIGEDPKPYQLEADKILQALNTQLWMPSKGWYAEYKDLLGKRLLHPPAGLWTIYHAIDERVADPFQAYQSLRYIDTHIPHIPVKAMGLSEKNLYVLSTTNWQPYEWSLNNVALAESQHTALAYWQGGNREEAYRIWRSSLIESMYLGASPGGFQQLTFYDAVRGELYRDFADPIGMTARGLVEGLFGIKPDALKDTVTIEPGWPMGWDHAAIQVPDINIDFKRKGDEDTYTIVPAFQKKMFLQLVLPARKTGVKSILLNGKLISWKSMTTVGGPLIGITSVAQQKYVVKVTWQGSIPEKVSPPAMSTEGGDLDVVLSRAVIQHIFDPQNVLVTSTFNNNQLHGKISREFGTHTFFLQLKQGEVSWWEPVNLDIKKTIEMIASPQSKDRLQFNLQNNSTKTQAGKVVVNEGAGAFVTGLSIAAASLSETISVPPAKMVAGSNKVLFYPVDSGSPVELGNIVNWDAGTGLAATDEIDMTNYFNDKVTNIFKNQYLAPRPAVPTLQLPTQGIGEWTHPLITANIDDRGLRKTATSRDEIVIPPGIHFKTPADSLKLNIAFTSQWNNYPREITIPLQGKASHVYLLMAGSTNPMQSRITNGLVVVTYTDKTCDTLLLKNPENWWPIEQDYYNDGWAFNTNAARPLRLSLKTGKVITDAETSIAANKGKMIDGGAATVLGVLQQ